MKVLLVNPASRRPVASILPPGVEGSRGLFPPLGILYLAAAVRDLPGLSVAVVDAHAEGASPDELALRVREEGIDLVGITTMTFSLLDVLDTALAIKAARPETIIVAGGPHPHLYPDQTLELGPFDAVVRGEGEECFRALLAGLPGERATPPGAAWKGAGKDAPAPAPLISDLDALPFPARDLTQISLYHSVLTGLRPITTMMSSRGCPYPCVFCDRPHLGKRFRARSAQNVVAEMEACAAAGIREVVFYDDTFTVSRERAREIAELILERGLKISWDIRARVGDLTGPDYRLLQRAGLCRVHFGVESGDPEILRAIKKGITVDQARESFRLAGEAGLETLAYFMVGLPGETTASLSRTFDLARELNPDFVHFSALIPFPGTPLYQDGLSRGIIARDVWEDFARSPSPDFVPPLWEERLTRPELLDALARMYRGFYGRPSVILKRLRRTRSLSGLLQGARMGLSILRVRGQG